MRGLVAMLLVASAVSACDGSAAPAPSQPGGLADPRLALGKQVWDGTCSGCHARGVAGAPVAGDVAAWMPRLARGRDVLYDHAINGFFGPGYTQMPPRGGNDSLSDDEVKAAVEYMLSLVET